MKFLGARVACFVAVSGAVTWTASCSQTSWISVENTPPPSQSGSTGEGAGGGNAGPGEGVGGGIGVLLDGGVVSVPGPATLPGGAEPPAISGGTLLVLADGTTAVAADPDRDVVWIVDLSTQSLVHQVTLQPGDEPGRVAEDAAGRVHVALRRGGALVSIDPKAGSVLARRAVCPAPRGLAYDASADALQVACMDGRLVTLPAAGGAATRTVQVDSDLRDVVIQGGQLYVSRFRAAELLQLAADGTVAQRITLPIAPVVGLPILPPSPPPGGGGGGGIAIDAGAEGPLTAAPAVAYRTVALPGGGLAMLHQRGQQEAVSTQPGGYTSGGACPGVGIVQDAVTIIQPGTAPAISPPLGMTTLAVDLAVSPDGTQIAIAAPGTTNGPNVSTYFVSAVQGSGSCALPSGPSTHGSVIAVAFDPQGNLVSQTRDPAVINFKGLSISLPGSSVSTAGHTVFHTAPGLSSIACASCHPEGGDDGRVWQFDNLGPRRTQNLRGGVMARMPFHWSGDVPDMDALVSVVLVGRMGGEPIDQPSIAALAQWMDAQPALAAPPPVDPASVARGATVFNDPTVGCTACHSGPQLSTHALVDVGTGGTFKVPSLIAVGYRAPYLHDGCATTLLDRFGPTCGGGDSHGQTQQLTAGQLGDLVAYLQTL